MNNVVEIGEKGVTVHLADGGYIVVGKWGNDTVAAEKPLSPLTADEEKYGRGLCLLPSGWDDLSGDEKWLYYLSDELKRLWPQLDREEKMAVAHAINELVDDLNSRSIEVAGY